MRLLRSRTWQSAAATLLLFSIGLGGIIYRNWDGVYSTVDYWLLRFDHMCSDDPFYRDMARGRFHAVQPSEILIATHPPDCVHRSGRFGLLAYNYRNTITFPLGGGYVIEMDGKIVSCEIGVVTFSSRNRLCVFDVMTPSDRAINDKDMKNCFLAKFHAHIAISGAAMMCSRHAL